ncbi:hypothetical protein HSBAA_31170 [Vreelandella sulfidaeris]|uniref:Radical SAM core domain-containing protein n=1 Tax=Vreelandella sulfidaeris TaxID=115553 RepID=A0A455UB67_9GAMM|nr:hypothetical protein HSBAA_31170 [Halomonas sulfidaeris]
MARAVKAAGYPMVLNVVLHRHNIDQIDELIALCDELGADAVELANCQYYGWAFLNRHALLPTQEQLIHAEAVTERWRDKLAGRAARCRCCLWCPIISKINPSRAWAVGAASSWPWRRTAGTALS